MPDYSARRLGKIIKKLLEGQSMPLPQLRAAVASDIGEGCSDALDKAVDVTLEIMKKRVKVQGDMATWHTKGGGAPKNSNQAAAAVEEAPGTDVPAKPATAPAEADISATRDESAIRALKKKLRQIEVAAPLPASAAHPCLPLLLISGSQGQSREWPDPQRSAEGKARQGERASREPRPPRGNRRDGCLCYHRLGSRRTPSRQETQV